MRSASSGGLQINILDSIMNTETVADAALDQNRDGAALDDITGMIGRTFGRS